MKPYRYITLRIQEEETLEEGLRNHAKSFYRSRCQALLLSHRRYKVTDIASFMQVRSHTVRLWMSNWEANGLAGLQISAGRGRKAAIKVSDVDLVAQIKEQLGLNPQQLNQDNALSLSPGQLLRFIKKS